MTWPLPNVHLGVSVENQDQDHRIVDLQQTPAAVRFISAEPLLGPLDLNACAALGLRPDGKAWTDFGALPSLDHVIVGGESGPGARPCNVEWIRSIVRDCQCVGVPVFVKQLGARPYEQHSEMDHCCEKAHQHPGKHPLEYPGADGISRPLRHRKGADMAEWPADLRVQEMPPSPPSRDRRRG